MRPSSASAVVARAEIIVALVLAAAAVNIEKLPGSPSQMETAIHTPLVLVVLRTAVVITAATPLSTRHPASLKAVFPVIIQPVHWAVLAAPARVETPTVVTDRLVDHMAAAAAALAARWALAAMLVPVARTLVEQETMAPALRLVATEVELGLLVALAVMALASAQLALAAGAVARDLVLALAAAVVCMAAAVVEDSSGPMPMAPKVSS